jgi:hypothetical protein
MKKNLYLLLLFMLCDFWIAQLQSISFEEIDSLQRIEKEKRLFSFKLIGANLSCDENTTFKTRNHQELNTLSILLISMPKRTVVFNKTTFNSNPREYFWNT